MLTDTQKNALVALNGHCLDAEKVHKAVKAESRNVLIVNLVPQSGDAHGEYLKNWEQVKSALKAAKSKMSGTFKSQGSQILRALENGVSLYDETGAIRKRSDVMADIKAAEGNGEETEATPATEIPLHIQPVADRLALIHAYAMGLDESAAIKLCSALDTFRTKYCK